MEFCTKKMLENLYKMRLPRETHKRVRDAILTPIEPHLIKFYEDFGNEVILVAMDDYADACTKGNRLKAREKELFFRSYFCNTICSMGAERLMRLARERQRNRKRRYEGR